LNVMFKVIAKNQQRVAMFAAKAMEGKMDTNRWIEDNQDIFIEISDQLWKYAELALIEFRSAELLENALENEGFTVERGLANMQTAFMGSYGDGRPVIAILGEFDALPSLSQDRVPYRKPLEEGAGGHGCGHNLFGAGSLAVAFAVAKAIEAGDVQGTVRYYGTPGEEFGSGKTFMAREGLFNDVDIALAWHPGPLNINFSMNVVAVIDVSFKFYGKSAHAAMAPFEGRSALDAVELMNVGVNYLREHIPPDCPISYVIKHGGGAPNVVPDFAQSTYMIRGPQKYVRDIYERVVNVGKGAALMTDTRMETEFHDASSGLLLNDTVTHVLQQKLEQIAPPSYTDKEEEFAQELARTLPTIEKMGFSLSLGDSFDQILKANSGKLLINTVIPYIKDNKPFPGGTDVGDVSRVTPTGQIAAVCHSICTPMHSWQAVAQHGMSIGHKGMLYAAKVLAAAAIEFMQNPDLIQQARDEFNEKTVGEPYVPLMPDDVMPHSIYVSD
jgi:aminobenzoyl-glutamate utilization protein B